MQVVQITNREIMIYHAERITLKQRRKYLRYRVPVHVSEESIGVDTDVAHHESTVLHFGRGFAQLTRGDFNAAYVQAELFKRLYK